MSEESLGSNYHLVGLEEAVINEQKGANHNCEDEGLEVPKPQVSARECKQLVVQQEQRPLLVFNHFETHKPKEVVEPAKTLSLPHLVLSEGFCQLSTLACTAYFSLENISILHFDNAE